MQISLYKTAFKNNSCNIMTGNGYLLMYMELFLSTCHMVIYTF